MESSFRCRRRWGEWLNQNPCRDEPRNPVPCRVSCCFLDFTGPGWTSRIWAVMDSNHRPADQKTDALPPELTAHEVHPRRVARHLSHRPIAPTPPPPTPPVPPPLGTQPPGPCCRIPARTPPPPARRPPPHHPTP